VSLLAADWVTISALATAGGTLILALATSFLPRGDGDWITAASRHWNVDRDDPR
jgi:hypothetical protein